jgi:uncharacterized protein YqjF (DUF2071 family)
VLGTAARQAESVRQPDHRPWPLPGRPWLMGQTWENLLFAHWRVPADALRRLLPAPLDLDTFADEAWLGITPFRLTGLRARGMLPLPYVSSFLELNVRTYVRHERKGGIWFFSLDASSALAAAAARRTYHLPYFTTRASFTRRDAELEFSSSRSEGDQPRVFAARYSPTGPTAPAEPGSLAHFLTERYCLYAASRSGKLWRADIHHEPWPLQPARAEIQLNTMAPDGVELLDDEPLLHFSRRQDVVIWPVERVDL